MFWRCVENQIFDVSNDPHVGLKQVIYTNTSPKIHEGPLKKGTIFEREMNHLNQPSMLRGHLLDFRGVR